MKLKKQNLGAQSGGTVLIPKGFCPSFRQVFCTANQTPAGVRNAAGIAFQTDFGQKVRSSPFLTTPTALCATSPPLQGGELLESGNSPPCKGEKAVPKARSGWSGFDPDFMSKPRRGNPKVWVFWLFPAWLTRDDRSSM